MMKFIHKHEKCPDYKDVDAIIAWHRNEIDYIQTDLDSTRKELAECRLTVKDLHDELQLNKTMLARQCDLSREAETELEDLRGKVDWYLDCCDTLRWYNDMYYDEDFYFEPWAMRSIQDLLHNAEAEIRAAVEKQAIVP